MDIDVNDVLYEVDGGVAVITFNRPDHRNGQTESMEAHFVRLLQQADEDPGVRVVIVTGAGSTFCPGADIGYLGRVSEHLPFEYVPRPTCLFARAVRKPVVAAINGACAGSGFLYALSCDVRIASRDAVFSTAFPRRGLNAERAASWLLMHTVSEGVARELLLSGRKFGAEEAAGFHLVNVLVEPGQALDAARKWAADVAANCSPVAMAMIKHQFAQDAERKLSEALADAAELSFGRLTSPELARGVRSFVEGTPPEFEPVGGPNELWNAEDREYKTMDKS